MASRRKAADQASVDAPDQKTDDTPFSTPADAVPEKQWMQRMMTYLPTGGQYASIIVLARWTLQILGKLLAVLSVRKKGFVWKTALQLNFNLNGQVRDTLLRNAPPPTPSDELELRPTGTIGTLALSK